MLFDELTHVLDPEPHHGSLNMAIDEALLRRATGPLLRVYRWARPTVSFGYFGRFDAVAARWRTENLVRRWTGGGEVPHGDGHDCTYTLIVPREHPFSRLSALESYRAIHGALALLFTRVKLAESVEPKTSEACFDNPAQFDLIFDGRKVAGGAQRRTSKGLLHQGSINHPSSVARDFGTRLGAVLARRCIEEPISIETLAAARELDATKYGTDAWLRRFDARARRGQRIACAARGTC